MKSQKQFFLKRVNVSTAQDALRNSLVASLQRNRTYKDEVQNTDREPLRRAIQKKLQKIEPIYSNTISDESHIQNIVEISNSLSTEFGYLLVGGRFRIGTSQKALNLFAKFLWCLNDNWPAPPHCPLDGTILKQVSIYGSWTKLDSSKIYREWIDRIRKHAHSMKFKSIAEWELNMWNKNG
jgi:hypothetical protein